MHVEGPLEAFSVRICELLVSDAVVVVVREDEM